MQQTNISPEQIKAQLPFFNGASSLSLLDALDNWKRRTTKAGIHKQIWGGIILSKLENPAYIKRDLKFEDICSSLKENFGGAMKASENIMKAHDKHNS